MKKAQKNFEIDISLSKLNDIYSLRRKKFNTRRPCLFSSSTILQLLVFHTKVTPLEKSDLKSSITWKQRRRYYL
jgi:hypothetical protein